MSGLEGQRCCKPCTSPRQRVTQGSGRADPAVLSQDPRSASCSDDWYPGQGGPYGEKTGFLTPTEPKLNWDALCFMVKTWARHKTTEA